MNELKVIVLFLAIIFGLAAIILNIKKKDTLAVVTAIFALLAFIYGINIQSFNDSVPNTSANNEIYTNDSETEPEKDSTVLIDSEESTKDDKYSSDNNIFLDAYEKHNPSNTMCSVEFRDWNSTVDFDLRNDNYSTQSGKSYFCSISNIINALGGGGSDSERIVSEIHLPIDKSYNSNYANMVFSGCIVAEQRGQGSGAYADIAILVDGKEQWRTEDSITCDTVRPIYFSIDISAIESEIIIKTSCCPIGSGISLGFIGLDSEINTNDTHLSADSSKPNELTPNEQYLFVNVFESHSPDNALNSVILTNWDTFTNADLRNEKYADRDGGQLLLAISDTFNVLGANSSDQIVSKIHLPINPKKDVDGLIWSGYIVAEQNTQGSSAYADIVIFIDGVEKWRTSEPIYANTVAPIEYSLDMSDAKYEVIIQTICTPLDNGLSLGFVNMNLEYDENK